MTVKIKSDNRIAEEKASAPSQKLEFLQRNRCLIVVLHVYNSTGGLSSTSQRSSSWFQLCSDSKETWRWLWPLGCPQRWDANLCFVKQTLRALPVCLKCLSLMDMPDVSLGSGGRVWYPFSSFIQPPAEFILWLLSQPGECPPSCCGGDVQGVRCAISVVQACLHRWASMWTHISAVVRSRRWSEGKKAIGSQHACC